MNNPARVLYISHLFPHLTLPEYGLNAYNAAIRINADVLVFTRKLQKPLIQLPSSSLQVRQISYPDSHLQLLRNKKNMLVIGFLQSAMGQLLLAIKSIVPARAYHPDIIHSFGALTIPAAYIVRLVTGAPVVVSLHGTDFHRINRSSFLLRWVGMADAIVCVSQHMVKELQKKLPGKHIFYCPSGVDLSIFHSEDAVRRQNEIVCVGRLTTVKRYDLIIKAFALIAKSYPEYRLRIMGRGELLEDLQRQAREMGVSGKVNFGGVVEREKLADILRSAKLFLMASDWEGTPKSMLEAMACGLPVASTDVGDCAYLIQGAGQIAKDHSPASIAEAALEVLGEEKWEEYSQQAVSNASRFDWQQVTAELTEVYRKLNPKAFCG